DEIGRRVIGLVVMQGFAAVGAMVGHLEEGAEHAAADALRAAPEKTAPERRPGGARRQRRLCCCVLPAHRRPFRACLALRPPVSPLSFPPRCDRPAAVVRRPLVRSFLCPLARMRAVASRRPSEIISNRSAPATGAASTRRTVAASPRR